MKQKNSYVFDDKDLKAVELFTNLGMQKNIAKTLMYISQIEECRSAEIEQGADLRQPEVSVAMQELRRKGWVTKKDMKGEGKGRPTHLYKSNVELSHIIQDLEKEKLQQVESVRENIQELKDLIDIS